jgi:hypothetical protein
MKKHNGNRNQHKRERKAARRKIIVAGKGGPSGMLATPLDQARAAAATSGIDTCMITDGIFDVGMGNVILARTKPSATVASAVFLLDVHCLGVKDAAYTETTREKFLGTIAAFGQSAGLLIDVDPECARKIVADAVAYAGRLGFAPRGDYPAAEALFGDVDAGACATEYVFGMDGKPFFTAGPMDNSASIRRVLRVLTHSVGEGNFDYTM